MTDINSEIVSARRVKALATVENQRCQAIAEIAAAGNPEALVRDAEARYKLLAVTCARQNSVAHLDQAATEAARIFESTVAAIERAAAVPPPPATGATTTYPKPNLPGPKPRHVVQVTSLLKKPFLESPEEVEEIPHQASQRTHQHPRPGRAHSHQMTELPIITILCDFGNSLAGPALPCYQFGSDW